MGATELLKSPSPQHLRNPLECRQARPNMLSQGLSTAGQRHEGLVEVQRAALCTSSVGLMSNVPRRRRQRAAERAIISSAEPEMVGLQATAREGQ